VCAGVYEMTKEEFSPKDKEEKQKMQKNKAL
jgi:hypothetical protein